MKIIDVKAIATRGLGKPWVFCIVRTDAGITGYSEFGRGTLPRGLCGLVEDLKPQLVGKDPLPVERRYAELQRYTEYMQGGATQQALAGVELALWDIKGKEAGKPVCELLGGPTKDRQCLYWSHLATYQAAFFKELGLPPLATWDDVRACVRQAIEAGYSASKCNLCFPGLTSTERAERMSQPGRAADAALLRHAETQIAVMREEAGPDFGIALDINKSFRPEAQIQIARALEPYNLMWLEIDNPDPVSLRQVRDSTATTILTGEALLGVEQFRSFFEARAMAICKLDLQWQGLISARQVVLMADAYRLNVVPHNFNGHLSTFQSLNLCASVTNVRLMEFDPLSAPFRDELFTAVPEIENGVARVPAAPGWGAELDEAAAARYEIAL